MSLITAPEIRAHVARAARTPSGCAAQARPSAARANRFNSDTCPQ